MKIFSSAVATIIRKVAEFGAGAASSAFSYEPKMPKKLKK